MFQNISANTDYVEEKQKKKRRLKGKFYKTKLLEAIGTNLYISLYGVNSSIWK